ncbi:hypothetical protein [Hirschia litorea]|uniref:Uncharacterized protein n=1 Tax=Hirschia litorea TaxID=1199156 RepID=A0ABW2IMW4_9PROT
MNDTSDSNKKDTPNSKAETPVDSVETSSETVSDQTPIDAEFENVSPETDTTPFEVRTTVEKSGPGWGAMLTTGAFSSIIGAAIAMVATGSSGVDTAKFAPAEVKNQIFAVEELQKDLNQRVQDVRGSISAIEARQNTSITEIRTLLDERLEGETSIRDELNLLTSHLETILEDGSTNIQTSENTNQTSQEDTTSNLDTDTNNDSETPTPSTRPSSLLAVLTQLDALETKIAELENSEAEKLASSTREDAAADGATQQVSADISKLIKRIEAVESAETNLTQAMQARSDAIRDLTLGLSQTQKSVKSIENDIQQLRTAQTRQNANVNTQKTPSIDLAEDMAKASLAVSKVEAASARGKPFSNAWNELAKVMPDENVMGLMDIARRGAPPLEEISTEFAQIKDTLMARAATPKKDDGWNWARKAMSGVVTVKRTSGDNIDNAGRLHNISKALDANNLAEAIKHAEAVDGTLSTEIESWLDGAKRRLAFDEGIETVRQAILQKSGVILPPQPKEPSSTVSDQKQKAGATDKKGASE